MAIPDYQKLMLPVLSVAAEGETRVPGAAQIIADRLGLTENEREEMLPSGKQSLLHIAGGDGDSGDVIACDYPCLLANGVGPAQSNANRWTSSR